MNNFRKIISVTALCFGLFLSGFAKFAVAQTNGMAAFETTKVAEGVYSFRFGIHRNMFIVTDEGVIATDPISPEAADIMMAEIRKITNKPVKYVIYSHQHWDHIAGGKVFKDAGATFVSQANCAPFFKANPNQDVVAPDETYAGPSHEIKLGGRTVELHYFGRNHGDCMTVMRLPNEKILFVVDLVTPKRVAAVYMPDTHPGHWLRTLREIEKLDFDRVITGHGPAFAPASAVREQREYLEDLMAAVSEGMKTEPNPFKMIQTLKLPKYKDWGFYEEWLPLNVMRIYFYYRMGV